MSQATYCYSFSNGFLSQRSVAPNYVPVTGEQLSTPEPATQDQLVAWFGGSGYTSPPSYENLILYAGFKQSDLAGGGVTVNVNSSGSPLNVLCSTDVNSKTDLNGLFLMAQINSGLTVPWVNGAGTITLSAAQILTMAPLVGEFLQETYAALSAITAEIVAGTITTTAEIDSYSWPSNGS